MPKPRQKAGAAEAQGQYPRPRPQPGAQDNVGATKVAFWFMDPQWLLKDSLPVSMSPPHHITAHPAPLALESPITGCHHVTSGTASSLSCPLVSPKLCMVPGKQLLARGVSMPWVNE